MKHYTFLLYSLLMGAMVSAQPYPFPTTDAWWTIEDYEDDGMPYQYRVYHLLGDTILDGINYQKIYRYWNPSATNFVAGMREDSARKVYIRFDTSTIERFIYDFSAELGDTLVDIYPSWWFEETLDTFVVTSKESSPGGRLSWTVQSFRSGLGYNWLEGIGATTDFLWPHPYPLVSGSARLFCFSNEGNTYYGTGSCMTGRLNPKASTALKIFPNPAQAVVNFELSAFSGGVLPQLSIFDHQGSEIIAFPTLPESIHLEEYPAGLYLLRFQMGEEIWHRKLLKE